jgi:hypothetical protein
MTIVTIVWWYVAIGFVFATSVLIYTLWFDEDSQFIVLMRRDAETTRMSPSSAAFVMYAVGIVTWPPILFGLVKSWF